LIAFPGLVTHYKTDPLILDQSDINEEINDIGGGGLAFPVPG
jgi:hypothetical protein